MLSRVTSQPSGVDLPSARALNRGRPRPRRTEAAPGCDDASAATDTVPPEVAIAFHKVSKKYVLRHERHRSLQQVLLDRLRLRWDGRRDVLWALHDVSFTLPRGCTLGIIG